MILHPEIAKPQPRGSSMARGHRIHRGSVLELNIRGITVPMCIRISAMGIKYNAHMARPVQPPGYGAVPYMSPPPR